MNMTFEGLDFQDNRSLYLQISEIIETKIERNEIPVGEKLPPLRNLCKEFGVSIFTVREAISKLVEEGYLSRRENHGTFVISTEPKKTVDLKKKNKIGFVICPYTVDANLYPNQYEKPHLLHIANGIEKESKKRNIFMIYSTLDGPELSLTSRETDLAGLILTGRITASILKMARRTRIPFVLIGDVEAKELTDTDMDVICIDDYRKSYFATKYLIDSGHRRIMYVTTQFGEFSWQIKLLKGYEQALGESGITYDKELLIETKNFDLESSHAAVKEFLEKSANPSFDGMIFTGGILYEGALKALNERKIAIPADAVILLDDRLPGLRALTYDERDLGRVAAERLFERLTNPDWKPERVFVPLKMIVTSPNGQITVENNI